MTKDIFLNGRNLTILVGHWFLHAFGIISLTQLTQLEIHLPILALVPFPTLFFILTIQFSHPSHLEDVHWVTQVQFFRMKGHFSIEKSLSLSGCESWLYTIFFLKCFVHTFSYFHLVCVYCYCTNECNLTQEKNVRKSWKVPSLFCVMNMISVLHQKLLIYRRVQSLSSGNSQSLRVTSCHNDYDKLYILVLIQISFLLCRFYRWDGCTHINLASI